MRGQDSANLYPFTSSPAWALTRGSGRGLLLRAQALLRARAAVGEMTVVCARSSRGTLP